VPCATCDVLTPPGADPAVERWAHPVHLALLVSEGQGSERRRCPECGARFLVVVRIGRHITGEWEEERVVSLGHEP